MKQHIILMIGMRITLESTEKSEGRSKPVKLFNGRLNNLTGFCVNSHIFGSVIIKRGDAWSYHLVV
jgi:hypothetical protein